MFFLSSDKKEKKYPLFTKDPYCSCPCLKCVLSLNLIFGNYFLCFADSYSIVVKWSYSLHFTLWNTFFCCHCRQINRRYHHFILYWVHLWFWWWWLSLTTLPPSHEALEAGMEISEWTEPADNQLQVQNFTVSLWFLNSVMNTVIHGLHNLDICIWNLPDKINRLTICCNFCFLFPCNWMISLMFKLIV